MQVAVHLYYSIEISSITPVYVHRSGGWRSVYILLHSFSTNESDQVLTIML